MADDPEIRYLGDVQRLVLNEGDALVLTVDGPLSCEKAAILRHQLEGVFGKDRKLLILSDGMKIAALAA